MKYSLLIFLALLGSNLVSIGQVNSGSDGHDGVFDPTESIAINMADHPDGIYHYSSVNIRSGVIIRFIRNTANTPVIWLIQGECSIAGTLDVSGSKASIVGIGGPGGGNGGHGGNGGNGANPTVGEGPGGGNGNAAGPGGAGSYATVGQSVGSGTVYGNVFLTPLLGGSGGGGGNGGAGAGGGGGGAILIAANGTIRVDGQITAAGGDNHGALPSNYPGGGAGSGGAIRIVTPNFTGAASGFINASGGYVAYGNSRSRDGGEGRIRIDASNSSYGGLFDGAVAQGSYFGGLPNSSFSLSGIVETVAGEPVPSATVQFKRADTVFWQGSTSLDGSIPATTLPFGNFNVSVTKSGYQSLLQSVGSDSASPVSLHLVLQPFRNPPNLTPVSRVPANTAIRSTEAPPQPGVRAANLRVFNGTSFSNEGIIRPGSMTVVISHGWKPNPFEADALSSWATDMAADIQHQNSLGTSPPNILAWDWSDRAFALTPPVDEAAIQGENLGKSLEEELGRSYAQHVHFIGHSLGTIVNSYACDYLHGRLPYQTAAVWDQTVTRPHVTLLDQAEVANVFGTNVSTSGTGAWFDAQSRSQLLDIVNGSPSTAAGYKNPFPKSAAWADSYISQVGFYSDQAVNAYVLSSFVSHGYSHDWYIKSILDSSPLHPLGFNRAYERTLTFPPTGSGLSSGSVWESAATSDPLDIRLASNPGIYVAGDRVLRAATVLGSTAIASADAILDGYQTSLQWVSDLAGEGIHTTGQVAVENSEKIGNFWDVAMDSVSTINPEVKLASNIVVPTWKLIMSTGAPSVSPMPIPGARYLPLAAASSAPPQSWVPVHIPENAAFLAFDFEVSGDPIADQIVCAINEQNLFTLPARFAPSGSPVSTDFLDVSAYAGQEVELYFGLVGGTSNGCTLSIDGLRFVTVPNPKLAANVIDNQISLKWPTAASGWVPQRNTSLDPQTWEDVPLDGSVADGEGVTLLNCPKTRTREFFRLRRAN